MYYRIEFFLWPALHVWNWLPELAQPSQSGGPSPHKTGFSPDSSSKPGVPRLPMPLTGGLHCPSGSGSSLEGSSDLREALSYQLEFYYKGDKSRPAKWRDTERQVWNVTASKSLCPQDTFASWHTHVYHQPGSSVLQGLSFLLGFIMEVWLTKLPSAWRSSICNPHPEAIRRPPRGSEPLRPNHVVDFLVQLAPVLNDLPA